jgi:2'-5' RNA ligase
MKKFRGFIAIDVTPFSKLIEFENELNNTGANIKLVEPKNIHITLKFLGDTDQDLIDQIEEIMKNSVKEIKPFDIELTNNGVFPNPNYIKVIWIGLKQVEKIVQISKKIDVQLNKIGFKKEKREFSPHLTIARVKSARNKDKLIDVLSKYKEYEFGKLSINSIKLKQSELTKKGPIYTTLREVKIGDK